MALDEVVVGATRRDLVYTVVDELENPVNLTGGAVRLQGTSADLPAKVIDFAGTLTTPTQGIITFASLGTLVTQAELTAGAVKSATFKLNVKYTDSTAKVDYTEQFEIIWYQDPLQPV